MGTAGHSRAQSYGAFTVQLNCGYVLLYSCSRGKGGLSVAWTMSTAAKGKAELVADNSLQSTLPGSTGWRIWNK